MEKQQKYWWVIAGASAVGLIASLMQTIERIDYALHPAQKLACDLNAVFSCSNVFDAWQSHVFGFSNSLICMMFFALTGGVALAGATGSSVQRWLRNVFHFFAVFFLGFGAWYLWQSTYRIHYICIYCLFCYAAVIAMNWAWFRLQYTALPSASAAKKRLQPWIKAGADVFVALLYAVCVAAMIAIHFSKSLF